MRGLRREVCHSHTLAEKAKLEADDPVDSAGALWMMRVQGHFQHAAYFRRYREFIAHCVLRSPEHFRHNSFHPTVHGLEPKLTKDSPQRFHVVDRKARVPADLVVYLRLGDKAESGDTLLTFASGYYDRVLKEIRGRHSSCWIVTVGLIIYSDFLIVRRPVVCCVRLCECLFGCDKNELNNSATWLSLLRCVFVHAMMCVSRVRSVTRER